MVATISKELFIEEVNSDNIRFGHLNITSTETIKVDSIQGCIFFEARGRMSSQKDKIQTFTIPNQSILLKNENYKIPFSFELTKTRPDTYQGINVNYTYDCEIRLNINESSLDKIERSIFTKLKSFVTADYSVKASKHFLVRKPNSEYRVVESKSNFDFRTNLIIAAFTAILFGGSYIFFIPKFEPSLLYAIIGFVSTGIMIFLVNHFVASLFGTVTLQTLRDEDSFRCKIRRHPKMNLTHQNLYYEIIEKVVDQRGTSSQTYHERIYISANKKLPDHKEISIFTFPYPDRVGLQSHEYKDMSIFWQMNLDGKYLGIPMRYKCIFNVKSS